MNRSPRILILTSCTGVKEEAGPGRLRLEDFQRGRDHIERRHATDLNGGLTSAENLYRGQQHRRLMPGVRAMRASNAFDVDLRVLSAGYGLLRADDRVAPYECSFAEMTTAQRGSWATHLGLETEVRDLLAESWSLALVLLGEDYLGVCGFASSWTLGGPTVVLCGARAALRLPALPSLYPLVLTKRDAQRFSCGLVGLKGEVGGRLLGSLAAAPERVDEVRTQGLLDELATSGPLGETPTAKPQALF